jgi:hypothetical protein
MTPYQRVVILSGIVLIAVIGLYPPWTVTYHPNGWKDEWIYHGHSLLFEAPAVRGAHSLSIALDLLNWKASIDRERLLIEWAIVATVTAGLVLILNPRRQH